MKEKAKPMKLLQIVAALMIAGATTFCSSTDGFTPIQDTCQDLGLSDYVLSGTVSSNRSFDENSEVCMTGLVTVASGATLTFGAGTIIYADTSTNTGLMVLQGGSINAVGTASSPVVFTSSNLSGSRAPGDWVGVIIQGEANYNDGSTGSDAWGVGSFGGSDDADNSGTLQYVRVEFAGGVTLNGFEHTTGQGLALQAVGSGTTIDHLQVHRSLTTALRLDGGTVSLDNTMLSHPGVYNLLWLGGWNGLMNQSLILTSLGGSSAIPIVGAADGTETAGPALSQFTILGDLGNYSAMYLLTAGATANMSNFYIAAMCGMPGTITDSDGTTDTTALIGNTFTAADGNTYTFELANSLFQGIQPAVADGTNCTFDDGSGETDPALIFLNNFDASADSNTASAFDDEGTNATPGDSIDYLVYDPLDSDSDGLGGLSLVEDFVPATVQTIGGDFVGAFDNTGSDDDDWTDGWTSVSSN